MRQKFHKAQKTRETFFGQFHGLVCAGEANAVLIVIYIRRVLQIPRFAVPQQIQRDQPQVLPRGVGRMAGIAFVFFTEQTGGVAGGFHLQGGGNIFGVFFGFGHINGNVQFPVGRGGLPSAVFGHAVGAYVIERPGIMVKFIRGGTGAARFIEQGKVADDFRRARGKHVHQARIKQIPLGNGIRGDKAVRGGPVAYRG